MDQQQPWYAPEQKTNSRSLSEKNLRLVAEKHQFLDSLGSLKFGAFSIVFALLGGAGIMWSVMNSSNTPALVLSVAIAFALLGAAAYFLICQMGSNIKTMITPSSPLQNVGNGSLAIRLLQGENIKGEVKGRGIPAPELALFQFVQQVRAYANEKSYQKHKGTSSSTAHPLGLEPGDILKRRWNEVVDSLGEFEIYLANDPKALIQKLVEKYPYQNTDVSVLFREVAEAFDSSWRRKGINIEAAIVTPLRAHTNEAILRRLLVGPWRSCAYFARRGNSLYFSAKMIAGKVVARWEVEGLFMKEDYIAIAQRDDLDVNERIERGLESLADDPNTSNILYALISFITWIDLVKACNEDFKIKPTNDGFAIELKLK